MTEKEMKIVYVKQISLFTFFKRSCACVALGVPAWARAPRILEGTVQWNIFWSKLYSCRSAVIDFYKASPQENSVNQYWC